MKTVPPTAKPLPARRALLVAALLLAPSGCRSTGVLSSFSPGPPAPEILAPTSTADQAVAVVNANTARVHSYVTNNASVSVLGLPNLPLLTGNIAYEQPQRFRFSARAITGPEVDFGSNDERLWLWARQMKGPDGRSPLYTVRHDQYAGSSAHRMLPVEPRWIVEALGLVTIPPGAALPPTPRADGKLEVRVVEPSPRGMLTRLFVIDPHGWVTEQSIIDPQGVLLASATAERFRYDPQTQVSLPEVVTVRVPAAELGLRIDVGSVVVNAAAGNSSQLFQPPSMQGHPVVDLGAVQQASLNVAPGRPAPNGWQAAGATASMDPLTPMAPAMPTAVANPATLLGPPPAPVAPAPDPPPASASVYQIPPTGVPF